MPVRLDEGVDTPEQIGVGGQPGAVQVEPDVVFESHADPSAGGDGQGVHHQLGVADAGQAPVRTGRQVADHHPHVQEVRLSAGDVAEDQVEVVRGPEHAAGDEVLGIVDHPRVERFQLGQDPPRGHLLGEPADHVGGVDAGHLVEVDRAEREAAHVGLQVAVELQAGGALVEALEGAPAGGDADDDVLPMRPDAGDDAGVDIGRVGRLLGLLLAGVQVDAGDADLGRPQHVLDDLVHGDGHVRAHGLGRDHPGGSEVYRDLHGCHSIRARPAGRQVSSFRPSF